MNGLFYGRSQWKKGAAIALCAALALLCGCGRPAASAAAVSGSCALSGSSAVPTPTLAPAAFPVPSCTPVAFTIEDSPLGTSAVSEDELSKGFPMGELKADWEKHIQADDGGTEYLQKMQESAVKPELLWAYRADFDKDGAEEICICYGSFFVSADLVCNQALYFVESDNSWRMVCRNSFFSGQLLRYTDGTAQLLYSEGASTALSAAAGVLGFAGGDTQQLLRLQPCGEFHQRGDLLYGTVRVGSAQELSAGCWAWDGTAYQPYPWVEIPLDQLPDKLPRARQDSPQKGGPTGYVLTHAATLNDTYYLLAYRSPKSLYDTVAVQLVYHGADGTLQNVGDFWDFCPSSGDPDNFYDVLNALTLDAALESESR
ncbi:MAG: hypothetical protein LKJ90_10275 [Faecalibacterium sp.]|nr:hypothetical protein [Faecalibacterium sp.]